MHTLQAMAARHSLLSTAINASAVVLPPGDMMAFTSRKRKAGFGPRETDCLGTSFSGRRNREAGTWEGMQSLTGMRHQRPSQSLRLPISITAQSVHPHLTSSPPVGRSMPCPGSQPGRFHDQRPRGPLRQHQPPAITMHSSTTVAHWTT